MGVAPTPDPQALHVDRLTTLHALRAEWDALLVAASPATVFQTWEWVTSWYEHFGRSAPLRVLAVRGDDGRLRGLAPCSLSTLAGGGPRKEAVGPRLARDRAGHRPSLPAATADAGPIGLC
ncbi:MAG TPA: hypothetical protein VNL16_08520 [Chloroflexota bacterium]|nr:hypothetical protein [Chloroflexota bacterium]